MTILIRRHCNGAFFLLAATGIAFLSSVHAQQKPDWPSIENDRFRIEMRSHTPQQIAAFYEARGFPRHALDEIEKACFTTIGIFNKSDTVLWLDLRDWSLSTPAGELKRLERSWWNQRWEQIGLPKANRATFRWTLLPEMRDLQPQEPVGGNITLPKTVLPVTLEARFATGKHREGAEYVIRYEHLRCPEEEPVP